MPRAPPVGSGPLPQGRVPSEMETPAPKTSRPQATKSFITAIPPPSTSGTLVLARPGPTHRTGETLHLASEAAKELFELSSGSRSEEHTSELQSRENLV